MLPEFLRMERGENSARNFRWPTTQHVYICWNFAEVFFVVSCFNLSDLRQCRILMCPVLYHWLRCVCCFFYKSSPLLQCKFHICWRLTAFPHHGKKKLFGYSSVLGLQSFSPLAKKNNATLSFVWIISNAWCSIKANKFASVDTSQFCSFENSVNCPLSINKSPDRRVFQSSGLPNFCMKTHRTSNSCSICSFQICVRLITV